MSKAAFKQQIRKRASESLAKQKIPTLYETPTDEQLANFACLMVYGYADGVALAITKAILTDPMVRLNWIDQHRDFVLQAARDAIS